MPPLLTTASVLMCPHGGLVQATSTNAKVQAAGAPVVRGTDTFVIAGCAFNIAGVPHPCVLVKWVQTALRCTVQDPALNQASVGLCQAADQAVQGPVMINSAQPRAQGL